MIVELHGRDRHRAAPLFDSLPALHGCVAAGLSGEFGRLWVDDAEQPTVAHLHLDFHFLVGDERSPVAGEMLRSLPGRLWIISSSEWEPLLSSTLGEALASYERTVFRGAPSDRDRLRGFVRALPAGYRLLRVTASEIERFAVLDGDLVKCFRDHDHFLAGGFGFAVEHNGEIVAGCSSFTQADGQVEIEVDTAKEHRRRGLALATSSALALHCLDRGLVPCWDAANEASARLASRLGFTDPLIYKAWFTKASG